MTVLIKGMEMPEGCRDCELGGVYVHCDDNGVYTEEKHRCSVTFYPLKDLAKRHEKCPLIEVPTPHGRLIDGDELYKKINVLRIDAITKSKDATRYWEFLDAVIQTPTVIRGSGGTRDDL